MGTFQAAFDSHNLASPPKPNMYTLHSWIGLIAALLFGIQVIHLLFNNYTGLLQHFNFLVGIGFLCIPVPKVFSRDQSNVVALPPVFRLVHLVLGRGRCFNGPPGEGHLVQQSRKKSWNHFVKLKVSSNCRHIHRKELKLWWSTSLVYF